MKKYKWLCIVVAAAFIVAVAAFIFFGSRYRKTELIIKKDGKQIYGQLYRPGRGNGRYPLVVLGHGYGGSYSDKEL